MRIAPHARCVLRAAVIGPLAMLVLAGCGGERPATRDGATTPRNEAAPAPEGAAMPATTSPSVLPPAPDTIGAQVDPAVSQRDARLDGFGPLRLGMTAAQAEAAWPGLFARMQGVASRRDCFHVSTGLPYSTVMFEGGRFVRFDAGDESIAAPGGGRRGVGEAELQALHGNALVSSADRFAPGGKLLSIQAGGVAPSKLVFVLRPDGVVDEWRVGLLPQADYDEGCESAG
jgi:hypothetical protein